MSFVVSGGAGSMPCCFENVAHRLIRDVVTNVGQGSLDPVVAPSRILLGKSHNKLDDLLPNTRPANLGALTAVIPFSGNQCDANAGSCQA
jgi:hypothetical protein